MTTEKIEIIKLTASDGKVLTDGKTYGTTVFLSTTDSPDNWSEVNSSQIPQNAEE